MIATLFGKILRRLGFLRPWGVTIISDCAQDANGRVRVENRFRMIFRTFVNSIPVADAVSAALNLVDVLDSVKALDSKRNSPWIIVVNAAPRDGRDGHFENGSPFGAFRVGPVLVIATVSGQTLSLLKNLGIISEKDVMVFETRKVLEILRIRGRISFEEAQYILETQFRSYEFVYLLAEALWNGLDLPWSPLEQIGDLEERVAYVDAFGNCVTNVLPQDFGWMEGRKLVIHHETIPCYRRLKDIPSGERGADIGSHGIEDRRFVELVVNGGNAAIDLGFRDRNLRGISGRNVQASRTPTT